MPSGTSSGRGRVAYRTLAFEETAQRVAGHGARGRRRTGSGRRLVRGSAASGGDRDCRKNGYGRRPRSTATMPSCSVGASPLASIRLGNRSQVFPETHVCSLKKKLLAQSLACSCSQEDKVGGLVVGRLGINMQCAHINMQHTELFAQATYSEHLGEYVTHNVSITGISQPGLKAVISARRAGRRRAAIGQPAGRPALDKAVSPASDVLADRRPELYRLGQLLTLSPVTAKVLPPP